MQLGFFVMAFLLHFVKATRQVGPWPLLNLSNSFVHTIAVYILYSSFPWSGSHGPNACAMLECCKFGLLHFCVRFFIIIQIFPSVGLPTQQFSFRIELIKFLLFVGFHLLF